MPRHDVIEAGGSNGGGGAPDAGLAQIAAAFNAGLGRADRPPSPQGPGEQRPRIASPLDIWVLRLPVLNLTGAGTIDGANNDWSCPTGRIYELLSVAITMGAGATNLQVFDEAAQPANQIFATTVSGSWEPGGGKRLVPGERLVFVATGGGVTIRLAEGNQIDAGYLPVHLT